MNLLRGLDLEGDSSITNHLHGCPKRDADIVTELGRAALRMES
jgi:hypothetical protein